MGTLVGTTIVVVVPVEMSHGGNLLAGDVSPLLIDPHECDALSRPTPTRSGFDWLSDGDRNASIAGVTSVSSLLPLSRTVADVSMDTNGTGGTLVAIVHDEQDSLNPESLRSLQADDFWWLWFFAAFCSRLLPMLLVVLSGDMHIGPCSSSKSSASSSSTELMCSIGLLLLGGSKCTLASWVGWALADAADAAAAELRRDIADSVAMRPSARMALPVFCTDVDRVCRGKQRSTAHKTRHAKTESGKNKNRTQKKYV